MLFSPDIAFLFLILGILGILVEITTPGASFPGIFGTISLLLAVFAFSFYEINYFGVSLIAISLILFIFEIKVISYGVLSLIAAISFAFGSYYIIEKNSGVSISMSLIITSSIVLIAISILMVYLGLNAQKNRKSIGSEALIGVEATASNDILPNQTGEVIILGERWRAKSSEVIHRGDTVIIEKVVGLTLYVKKG